MEKKFIDWLQERLGPSECVEVGIGDDAAVLQVPEGESIVVATDMVMDGAHFVLTECGGYRAGHKALGVNLSDLAAMAAQPLVALVSLALPRRQAFELGQQIIEGMIPLSETHRCALVGGDTNVWSGPAVINVAVIGTIGRNRSLTRTGARPGDWILLTGACGGSALGRHLDVAPRVSEALLLHERYEIHAAIDVSDGLAIDLSKLAAASRCGAIVELRTVPIHADADEWARRDDSGQTGLDHALGDGEDFELILAVPPDEARRAVREQPLAIPVTKIGEFVSESGLWSVDACGTRKALARTGFEHK